MSNDCTFFPEGPWSGCCKAHDDAYHIGGCAEDRLKADKALRHCIKARGYPALSWLMYAGIRVFGTPFIPWPWRWGKGHGFRISCTYHKQVELNK